MPAPPLDTPHDAAADEIQFFANREKVYPRRVQGVVRRAKWAVLALCLAVYYIAPWLRWDRGPLHPNQALLIDMAGRRAYFFWVEIWPEEIYYLAGILILAALALFCVTSLFGRMWCGFSCPQTVWTDLFMWTERLIEGDRMQRMRLDQAPLSVAKIWKKSAKHLSWLVIAFATGGAWIMYFNDAPTVARQVFTLEASTTVYFFIGLFTATTYLLAGWAREQVCTYMCPWPRIQAAMVDEETLTVTYRDWRGEPRGKHRKGQSWEGHGDCVDCHACVAVCPTGIDIRDGLQLECIGCGLCIDACTEIMVNVDRPPGLIAFDSPAKHLPDGSRNALLQRILRPRTYIYIVVMLVASTVMTAAFLMRSTATLAVLPDRSPLYVKLSDGSIRNAYTFRIENRYPGPRLFTISADGLSDGTLNVQEPGEATAPEPIAKGVTLLVQGDSVASYRGYVTTAKLSGHEAPLTFTLRPEGVIEAHQYKTEFHGPGQ